MFDTYTSLLRNATTPEQAGVCFKNLVRVAGYSKASELVLDMVISLESRTESEYEEEIADLKKEADALSEEKIELADRVDELEGEVKSLKEQLDKLTA